MRELVTTIKNYDKIRADLNKSPEILEAERLEEEAKRLRASAVSQEGMQVLNILSNVLDIIDSSLKPSSNSDLGRSRIISAAWALSEHYKIDLEEYFDYTFVK